MAMEFWEPGGKDQRSGVPSPRIALDNMEPCASGRSRIRALHHLAGTIQQPWKGSYGNHRLSIPKAELMMLPFLSSHLSLSSFFMINLGINLKIPFSSDATQSNSNDPTT